MNLYPASGKKLKSSVRMLNISGYLLSDLLGIGAGVGVGFLLNILGLQGILPGIICVLPAGIVAAIFIFGVWFGGLLLWSYSDITENVRGLRDREESV